MVVAFQNFEYTQILQFLSSSVAYPKMVRLPNPVRAIALRSWPGRDETDMAIWIHQPLLIVSIESDTWCLARDPRGGESYVPRAYIEFLSPVSGVSDDSAAAQAYKNWALQVARVLEGAGRSMVDGSDERKKKEKVMRSEGALEEGERAKWHRVDSEAFPFPPSEVCTCELLRCKERKTDTRLGACRHDVERLLKGVGREYNANFLWRESLKWHPDKWVRFLANDFVEGKKVVTELFVIIKELADEKREQEQHETKAEEKAEVGKA